MPKATPFLFVGLHFKVWRPCVHLSVERIGTLSAGCAPGSANAQNMFITYPYTIFSVMIFKLLFYGKCDPTFKKYNF